MRYTDIQLRSRRQTAFESTSYIWIIVLSSRFDRTSDLVTMRVLIMLSTLISTQKNHDKIYTIFVNCLIHVLVLAGRLLILELTLGLLR